jgi:MerR family copper efflux transcriptional regulator
MNIGQVAERSGVPAKTIRYYESIGLIEAAERRANGYRDYDWRDVETLRFVHRGRSLGFAIEDVANLLALYRDKRRTSHQVKQVALQHVERIDRKLAELRAMRQTLLDLTERCHGDDRPECPILADLAGKEAERRS